MRIHPDYVYNKREHHDVALIKLEELCPFPYDGVQAALRRHPSAEVVWCQEEPRNMGGWHFIEPYLEWVLNQVGSAHKRPRYAGRAAAAEAVGHRQQPGGARPDQLQRRPDRLALGVRVRHL